MVTIHNRVLNAFDISDMKNFGVWKRELRHHDITCDVINKLDGIPQGTRHHPEFDALIHTWLVCRAVMKMGRADLLESAFLHDYGKGNTTNIGSDTIHSYGHPRDSVRFIDNIKDHLQNYDLTRYIVDKHMNFPLDHHKLKSDVNLFDFVIADKKISTEIFLGEASPNTITDNVKKESLLFARQHNSTKTVTIMVGPPGSGKSRYLKNVPQNLIVSPDAIRRKLFGDVNIQGSDEISGRELWRIVIQRMKILLATVGKVYLDACNCFKFQRIEFMANFNYCKKTAIVFDVPLDVCIQRVRDDITNGIDRSDVPEKVITRFHKYFEKGKTSLVHEFNEVIEVRMKG